MKKTHFLYGMATFAIIGLIVGVISYATDTHTPQTLLQQAQAKTTALEQEEASATETPPTVKKTPCGCCSDRIARLQEQIRKARERRQAAQRVDATENSVSQKTP